MKKSLCVVFGGKSPEHEISLKSATSVIKNLDREKYDIHMLGITKDGSWFLYTGDENKITLSLRDADVKQVLRVFADKANMNVVQ